jgi:hypothetical protein
LRLAEAESFTPLFMRKQLKSQPFINFSKGGKYCFLISLALPGWLSLRNFGMPDVTGCITYPGNKHTNLLPEGCPNLAVKGSAPKFSKRTILAGLVSFLLEF